MKLNFLRSNENGQIFKTIYLPSFLFLTLSNLTFLIPIFMSLKRQLHAESLIYTLNMLFSIVSHSSNVL